MPSDTDRLSSEAALCLVSLIHDGASRTLCITVDGTRVNDETSLPDTGLPELNSILAGSREIVVRPGYRRYVVQVANVVAYQVRNESYALTEPDEDFSTMLRHCPSSKFLRHMRDTTCAEAVLDTPLEHWAVVTLDDVVDIVVPSGSLPEVSSRVLMASDLWGDGT